MDGQTYVTKLIVVFRNFANARKGDMTGLATGYSQQKVVVYYTHPLPTSKIFSNFCSPFLAIITFHVTAKLLSNSLIT